jgi:hypothetical protein
MRGSMLRFCKYVCQFNIDPREQFFKKGFSSLREKSCLANVGAGHFLPRLKVSA